MAIHAPCGLAMLLTLGFPAWADDCRLALVLALDVSSSVDRTEYWLQREGLARAVVAPEVVRAFLTGDPVALYVFEWSSSSMQAPLLPGWQVVEQKEDLLRIASAITAASRHGTDQPHSSTAVGAALSHAARALQASPDCRARTIDVAGDGANNQGPGPRAIYWGGLLDGVTVNALIVDQTGDDSMLVIWFERIVLQGPDAFWILADGYEDYERAMTAKLLRELELPLMSGLRVAEGGA